MLCVVAVNVVVVVEEVEGGEGGREGGRRRRETNRTIWAKVSLKISETEQPYQVKRMIRGIEDMLISIFSQTWKWERSKSFFGEPLKHVITLVWANSGEQNWR